MNVRASYEQWGLELPETSVELAATTGLHLLGGVSTCVCWGCLQVAASSCR